MAQSGLNGGDKNFRDGEKNRRTSPWWSLCCILVFWLGEVSCEGWIFPTMKVVPIVEFFVCIGGY